MTRLSSLIYTTLIIALLGLSACSRPASSTLFTATRAAVSAPLPQIEVLRGNVLVVDGRHLRLVDIVIPAAAPAAHCVAEAIASRQAEVRLEALTRHVRQVVVTPVGGVDAQNRTLAHVLLDGVDPAKVLIDEGLAVAPQKGVFDWCGAGETTHPAAQHIALLSFSGPVGAN